MAYNNSILHTQKEAGYPYLFGGLSNIETAFLMPSAECRDVVYLLDNDIISTDTFLYVIEKDQRIHAKMINKLRSLGFSREKQNLHDFLGELHDFPRFEHYLDLCFVDLCGTITMDIARWMATTLSDSIHETTRLCFTAAAVPRNNIWIDEVWSVLGRVIVPQTTDSITTQFGMGFPNLDKNLSKPILWLHIILNKFNFNLSAVKKYKDTMPMFSVYLDKFVVPDEQAQYSQKNLELDFDPVRVEEFYTRERSQEAKEPPEDDIVFIKLSAFVCKEKVKDFLKSQNYEILTHSSQSMWVVDNATKTLIYADARSYFELLEYFQIP